MSEQPDILADAIDALGEAAADERSIRFGHEVARVLHAGLLDKVTDSKHEHAWQPLGYDRPGGGQAFVVQACVCGAARSSRAES